MHGGVRGLRRGEIYRLTLLDQVLFMRLILIYQGN